MPKRRVIPPRQVLRDDVHEFKREIILRTAADIFFRKGFHNTTVDEIAEAMSVSKAVVYWAFSSKQEVLEEIADRGTSKLVQSVNCISSDWRPAENLAAVCFRHSATVLTHQKELAVYLFERRTLSSKLMDKINSRRKQLIGALVKILESGVASGEFRARDCELVAYDIVSMISMTFDWSWHYDKGHSLESLSRHFAEQALRLAGYQGEFPFNDGALSVGLSDSAAWLSIGR